MIRVQCPHCQRRYRTEMGAFGQTAVCTKCSQAFKIGEARPPFQWKTTELAEDSWIGVTPPEEKQEMKHCIICDAPLRPEMVRCPECGANQVTGMVHRNRPRDEEDDKPSIWSIIPVRLILAIAGVLVVGAGIFWIAKAASRAGMQASDEAADTGRVGRIAKQLDSGDDETSLGAGNAGYVNDSNIERFARMLTAGLPNRQRAVVLMIGAGQQTNVGPVLEVARSKDTKAARAGLAALQAIGPRRLLELSNHADEKVRRTAADAIAVLFDLDAKDARVAQLAQAIPAGGKTRLLNEICRPWPELSGDFLVNINGVVSPFTVHIEQVGKAYYLTAGGETFVSGDKWQFTIPLHRWCKATGSAVDAGSVREMLGGAVYIMSRVGASWEGQVAIKGLRHMTPPLPGFLPLAVPAVGETMEAPLKLERPSI